MLIEINAVLQEDAFSYENDNFSLDIHIGLREHELSQLIEQGPMSGVKLGFITQKVILLNNILTIQVINKDYIKHQDSSFFMEPRDYIISLTEQDLICIRDKKATLHFKPLIEGLHRHPRNVYLNHREDSFWEGKIH